MFDQQKIDEISQSSWHFLHACDAVDEMDAAKKYLRGELSAEQSAVAERMLNPLTVLVASNMLRQTIEDFRMQLLRQDSEDRLAKLRR